MAKLYIINRTDFQEDLLEEVVLLEGDITLLIYGNTKKLMKSQKEVLEEIEDNINLIDKLHCGEKDVRSVTNYISQNYSEYSLNDEEHHIELLGPTTKEQLTDLLSGKTLKNNRPNSTTNKSKSSKRKKRTTNFYIDCSTTETTTNEEDQAKEETVESKPNNETTDTSEEKVADETPTKQEEVTKTEETATTDFSQIGKVNEVKINTSRRRVSSADTSTNKKSENVEKENIALRKKYEAKIINNEPMVTGREEIIDDEVESRAEFLTQRIISIRKIIEKIIKRCNVPDFEVTNDVAFTWVINIIQTYDIEQFNNHLREDISVTPTEYKLLTKLALNYYDLCNRIYEVDINE